MRQYKVISYAKVIYLFLFFSVIIFGCKEDETPFGINIQPDKDKTFYRYFETSNVHLYTKKAPALNTSIITEALLGNITDSLFGTVKCDFLTEFLPNKSINTDTVASVTEVVLHLYSEGYYGITDSQLVVFQVYPVIKKLEDSLASDIDIDLYYEKSSLLSEKEIMLYTGDEIYSFDLPLEYWSNLIEEMDIIEKNKLRDYFNGYYITSLDNDTAGCLRNILLNYSYIEVNYLTPENAERTFILYSDTSCKRVIRYFSDYNENIKANLSDTINNSKAYIKSLGGLDAIIKIPDLNTFKDSLPLVINKAYLLISGKSYKYKETDYTSSIVLQDNKNGAYIDDYITNNYSVLSDGFYNIVLTQEVNKGLMKNSEIPQVFKLSPQFAEKYRTPTGVELSNENTKLIIIYHKLSQ